MIFAIPFLKKVMDKVRDEPAFKPTKQATYCNLATYKLLCELGIPMFWDDGYKRPMLANEMCVEMEIHPERFSKFTDHLRAWTLARDGHLIFAARVDHPHGHICPLYPSEGMITSGKWKAQVPVASNVGIRNELLGVNFCFSDPPTYYLVI